jgi:hypothetical protein
MYRFGVVFVFEETSTTRVNRIRQNENQTTVMNDIDHLSERDLIANPFFYALVAYWVEAEKEFVGEKFFSCHQLRHVLYRENTNVVSQLTHTFVRVLPAYKSSF